jgi:Family of unknown function (DUF6174)
VTVGGLLAIACHGASPTPPAPPPVVTVVPDSVIPPPRRVQPDTALSTVERDAIVREAQTRRAAWRALGIQDYHIRVAAGCFCPWPQTPAILEVRHGVAVELRDTTGRKFGPLREPWSVYTVEGLFDLVEQAARRNDMVEVTYNARFGYPTYVRGDARLGLPDDWFWVRATELTPRP